MKVFYNLNRTKIRNIKLILLETKWEHFSLSFHREKISFIEGAGLLFLTNPLLFIIYRHRGAWDILNVSVQTDVTVLSQFFLFKSTTYVLNIVAISLCLLIVSTRILWTCAMSVYIVNVDLHEKYEVFNQNNIDGNDSHMLVIYIWLPADQVYLIKVFKEQCFWILRTFCQKLLGTKKLWKMTEAHLYQIFT